MYEIILQVSNFDKRKLRCIKIIEMQLQLLDYNVRE